MVYSFDAKRLRDRTIAAVIAQTRADLLQHGASSANGLPLDVSMRMGMANLLSTTGPCCRNRKRTSRGKSGCWARPASSRSS